MSSSCKGCKEGGEWGMDHNGVGQQPRTVGPNTGRDWDHRGRLFQRQPGLCPQPGAVSNSSTSSHLPLPCGNQSLLRKVSTNAPLAPGAIDAGSRNISVGLPTPTSSGRALMHVTLMCLLWFSEAPPEAQLCPLWPLPLGTWGAVTLGAGGPEHRDRDWGDGTVPENRLWRSLRDSHLAPGQAREAASRFCGAWKWSFRIDPQTMPVPEPPH